MLTYTKDGTQIKRKFFLYLILPFFSFMQVKSSDIAPPAKYNLHFTCGASTIFTDYSLRPTVGLEFSNSQKIFSLAYKYDFPFRSSLVEYNTWPYFLEHSSHQYLELKFNSVKHDKNVLCGSIGICRLHIGPFPDEWVTRYYSKNLVTASLSYPLYWIKMELRYNLLLQEITRENNAGYSHFSFCLYYKFKPFRTN